MYLPLDFVCFFIGDFPFSDMLERKQGWDSLPQSTPYPPYSGTFLVWVPPIPVADDVIHEDNFIKLGS